MTTLVQTLWNLTQAAFKKAAGAMVPMAFVVVAAPVSAQDVNFCDDRADLESVPEPWAENTRTFANGQVRVAVINALEPAVAPYFFVILHPPRDEYGARNCSMVGSADSHGYAWLEFENLQAEYDPAIGLTLSMPGRLRRATAGTTEALDLTVTINQATGSVIARHIKSN